MYCMHLLSHWLVSKVYANYGCSEKSGACVYIPCLYIPCFCTLQRQVQYMYHSMYVCIYMHYAHIPTFWLPEAVLMLVCVCVLQTQEEHASLSAELKQKELLVTELKAKVDVLTSQTEKLSEVEMREDTAQSVINQLQQEIDKKQQELDAVSSS